MATHEKGDSPWPHGERLKYITQRLDAYEAAWRAARNPRIADYLNGLEGEARGALWMRLVMLDQSLRQTRGETPTLGSYVDSLPDRAPFLDVSTDGLDPGSRPDGPPETEVNAASAGGGSPAIMNGDVTADRSDPVVGPDRTSGSREGARAPNGPPSTVGPGRGPSADDGDGLAIARPGARLGDYMLLEKLGSGGMGVVFKARQQGLNRVVALKMIKAGMLADDRQVRLFRSEAEAVAALDHPHIVPVLDSGEYQGLLYYSMKLVDGQDLSRRIDGLRDDPRAIARLVAKVAEAIAHAHRRGVLHRDIKPSNILLDAAGEPHVIDFGVAMRLDTPLTETVTGHPVGTPSYMSPEQARGHRSEITTATDVYGLGTLLYTLLSGSPPFSGGSAVEILAHVIEDDPPRPRVHNPRVDRDLEIICLSCLGKDPGDRYGSAQEVADDLNRWLDGRPILARPASRLERGVKWVRRHKLIAVLFGIAVIGAILGVSGMAWGWTAAVAARDEARRDEDIARRLAYASTLNLAERDWRDARVSQVLRRLDQTRPPAGKTDLRGFEWYYLDRLTRASGATMLGHMDVVQSVAYRGDGKLIATGSLDSTVKLWDPQRRTVVRTIQATRPVLGVAFHPDGGRIASVGRDGEAIVWDAATGAPIHALKGHEGKVIFATYSRDGKRLATTGWDGKVRLWDADTGALLRVLDDHKVQTAGSIAFLPDSKTLASAGGGSATVRLWDTDTGQRVRTLSLDHSQPFYRMDITHDGRTLATATTDGRIVVWDLAAGTVKRTIRNPRHTSPILSLRFSPDGQALATTDDTSEATIWDVETGLIRRFIRGHNQAIEDIAFSPDGLSLVTGSWDETAKIWPATRDQEARLLRTQSPVRDAVFSADSSFLASAGVDGSIVLWDRSTGQAVRTLRGHTGSVTSLAMGPDSRLLASSGTDRSVRVWEVATGRAIHVLTGHTDSVSEVAFSADGKSLASAGNDRAVIVWDAEAGRQKLRLEGHAGPVKAVAFGALDRTLVSSGTDGLVVVWDVLQGRRIRMWQAADVPIFAIAVSPDGHLLATGAADASIRLWDLASGKEVRTLRGHASGINAVSFSRDGKRLLSASDDHTARFWDPVNGQELLVLPGHTESVWSVVLSADETAAATASGRAVMLMESSQGPAPGR